LDASRAGDFPEFEHVGDALGDLYDLIDPLRWSGSSGFLLADPFTCRRRVVGGGQVPGNARDYKVLVSFVCRVRAYSQGGEAFPVFFFGVP
jgi:hypothetical protein